LPMSTLHTCRRSASGWRTASTMRPTTTPARPSPRAVTSSTSRPMAVSVAASPSRLARVDTWLRSQFSENFMGCRDSWFVIRDWKCRGGDGAVADPGWPAGRSEEHTSELQSRENLVCRLLLEKKNTANYSVYFYFTRNSIQNLI